jgi:hypothetical protein
VNLEEPKLILLSVNVFFLLTKKWVPFLSSGLINFPVGGNLGIYLCIYLGICFYIYFGIYLIIWWLELIIFICYSFGSCIWGIYCLVDEIGDYNC